MQSASELLAYLRLEDHVTLEFEKAWNYAERRSDEDTRVSKYQAYTARCMSLYTQLEEAGSWFNAEFLFPKIPLRAFMQMNLRLNTIVANLEQILRMRAHTLSAAEEALLARANDAASQPANVYSMFEDADLTFDDATDKKGQNTN